METNHKNELTEIQQLQFQAMELAVKIVRTENVLEDLRLQFLKLDQQIISLNEQQSNVSDAQLCDD